MIALLLCASALAADDDAADVAPTGDQRIGHDHGDPLEISGFVTPVFSVVTRTNALPEDQLQIGLTSSKAGIVLQGSPVEQWSYRVFFTVGGSTVQALTGARAADTDNDGRIDTVVTSTADVIGDMVRETSVSWLPVEGVGFRVGQMPVPFTSTAQSPDTALLFPTRAGPNSAFLADDDLGGLLELDGGGLVLLKTGIFNGSGTGDLGGQRGVLYLMRVDIQPLGEFQFDETNPLRSDPRIGIGFGGIWHPYNSFDGAGFVRVAVNDFRGSASARFGVAGFTMGIEGLHRMQIDNLTNRPTTSTGGYGQAGWVLPAAIEPIARVGWVVQDSSFDPRNTLWIDLGVNLYPAFADEEHRDKVRFTAAYLSENRLTEGETAQGATLQLQLKF